MKESLVMKESMYVYMKFTQLVFTSGVFRELKPGEEVTWK